MPVCLFCRIASGGVPASRVLESPRTLSFRDISPQAPAHVLVIPKDRYPDLDALASADGGGLLTELAAQAREVAGAEGISGRGYRVVLIRGPTLARLCRTGMRTSWAATDWAGLRAERSASPGLTPARIA